MGIIARQSISSSLLNVVSTVLGVVAMLFIYTKDLEAYGFLQTLIAFSLLLSPFASLGMNGVAVKYFPNFGKSPEDRPEFLGFLVAAVSAGSALFVGVYFLLGIPAFNYLDNPSNNFNLYVEHALAICALSVIQVYISLFENYLVNFYQLTAQTVTTLLLPKVGLPIIILVSINNEWGYGQLELALITLQLLVLICLIGYLFYLGETKFRTGFKKITGEDNFKELLEYAAFGILGAVGTTIALSIDTVSLASYVTPEEVGVYRILVFAALVINIPFRALVKISIPSLSKFFADENYQEVEILYRRTSRILSFLGIALFSGIFISLSDIFLLTGNATAFAGGLVTFVLLGIGRIIDVANSINGQIISLSDIFKYHLGLVLFLAALNIILNWLFIARLDMGMSGAALATCIALAVYNLLKSLLVYRRFRMQPFQFSQMLFLVFGGGVILLWSHIPLGFSPILNILVRSIVTGSLFLSFVMLSPYLPDLRETVNKTIKQFF
jgi:O-antigen/teichoic acid export membrane protein